MNDSLRKSCRLEKKEKGKKSLSRVLRYKFSKDTEEDEDIILSGTKQDKGKARSRDDFELDTIIRKPPNNLLRVHNSYCSDDRRKYDGYDADFIDDGDVYSSSNLEEEKEPEVIKQRPRGHVLESSSGSEMEFDEREIQTEITVFETPSKDVERRNGLKREKPHSSDEDIMNSARKQKISILSSSTDSNSDNDTTKQHFDSQRSPSVRSLKVQAKMNTDKEEKFANFRANRLKSKKTLEAGTAPVSTVANLGLIKRSLREEAGVLPIAHQDLCANRALLGEDSDSLSDGDTSLCHASYLEALDCTKQLIGGDEPTSSNSNHTVLSESPTEPLVFEFSDYTADDPVTQCDPDISLKLQLLCGLDSIATTELEDFRDESYPAIMAAYDISTEAAPVFDLTDSASKPYIPVDECDVIQFSDQDCPVIIPDI